ncbi:alpha/beta fold hydrolase [Rhodopila sp.]|jgi:pimeloyl-ACP methyl ester carboxylesterase|uniref:alpha/beta fold hydrolase n=1 Tax=Rhodopila sp. TaxID=2480087 RepID=UPI002C853432|nr:alpha/beta hydrolase [Rhodopila sp.]HVZ08228.1 alpha/beta hydrolase [Rhodopila sp.]
MAQRRRVSVRYGTVRIDVIGDNPASPTTLVMLPSAARDSEDFDDIAERFAAQGLRVLRPQPRGMGASVGPMAGLTLHDYARDVAATIEQYGSGPAFVLGHAFGQWVARCLAADHPHRVRGVILAAAAARTLAPDLREALAIAGDPTQPRQARLSALRKAFFAPGHDPSPWLHNWHPAAARSQRAAGAATPIEDWWHAGTAPILDLQAEHDPWRPPETRDDIRVKLGADRVTVVLIDGASHALIPEQPAAVVKAVTDWMTASRP